MLAGGPREQADYVDEVHPMRYPRTAGLVLAALVLAAVAAACSAASPPPTGNGPRRTPVNVAIAAVPADPRGPVTPASSQFSYGFDFAQQGPYPGWGSSAAASTARRVLSAIPGMLEVTPIMDWGLPSPEPTPGTFNLSGIAERIRLITSTGGTPVVTLCGAPRWMTDGGAVAAPIPAPTPAHYHAFALLAAKIARSFPQVKYFVVWNEFKDFWNPATRNWDYYHYTVMYNDVYTAIKRVRPDALVGGPYAPTTPSAGPGPGDLPSTPHGAWGYVSQQVLNAISYWLAHKVGADFIAVDGPDFPTSGPITDPLTATEKYAAVDQWLRRRTALPIWWMESPVQPPGSDWSASQAAAIRVAALMRFASSGARAGLQWQPQWGEGIPDEGLWTATQFPSGGQPTVLAQLLPRVLAVLRYPTTLINGQSSGVLVARSQGGTIAVNTTSARTSARITGSSVTALAPGQVTVTLS
jgi:hypothetical protein